jgi:hypothetical protein
MFRGSFLILFFIFFAGFAFAQQPADSARSYYVQSYPKHFFVWPVLKYRSLSFEARDVTNDGQKVSFKPNNTASLGVGMYVFDLSFELTFAVPLNESSRKIYGETDARDFQLNILAKSWGVDIYHQKYSGFYKDDARVNISKDTPYPQRPDIDTRNFGVSGFYVVNNKKFSMRAPYNYVERQLKSKGSLILYGTLNSFKVEADSALLSQEARAGFGEGSDFKNLKYTTLSVAPGYSYTAVVKRFFVNGTLTFGPAHHWVYYKGENGAEHYDINFSTTYSVRLAAGYNSSRFFGGVGMVIQSRVVKFEDIRFENSTSTVRMLIGYRFKKRGVLEKHAWELLPSLQKD